MVKLVKILLFRFPNFFDNFVSSDFKVFTKVINVCLFLNCRKRGLRFLIRLLMWHVIHGKSLGLTDIFLFGMDFSAAEMIAPVMSLIFWSILSLDCIMFSKLALDNNFLCLYPCLLTLFAQRPLKCACTGPIDKNGKFHSA